MARLPRPHVPMDVDLLVILRQIGEMFPGVVVQAARRKRCLRKTRDAKLAELSELLGCDVKDLELDHDPALINREKLVDLPSGRRCRVVVVPKGAKVLRYFPDANHPEYLRYRPKAMGADGSHRIKTRVRGDHGQLSDLALARKERNRVKKIVAVGKRNGRFGKAKLRNGKQKIPSRQLKGRSQWPPKGSRKVNWRSDHDRR